MTPPIVRRLLDDECFRLQGHEWPTYEAVLRQAPGDEVRRAGLAGRGVAAVVAAEAARLQMDTAVRRPGDRCAGGPQLHTR